MNKLIPIPETEAKDDLKRIYGELRHAFGLHTLPVFFTYMGPFCEYLSYLCGQLIPNLTDSAFEQLVREESESVISKTHAVLFYPLEMSEWIKQYKNTPSFYSFQKDLGTIITANIKLAFVFVALREAVKGWAIAAKKLPEYASSSSGEHSTVTVKESEFVTEDFLSYQPEEATCMQRSGDKNKIISRGNVGMEKNILPEYILMSEKSFNEHKTDEKFWRLRVNTEKQILDKLELFPHLIFSPYNLIVKYTQKYENFYELIYLLSERFPTLSMQRLLFSAYLYVL